MKSENWLTFIYTAFYTALIAVALTAGCAYPAASLPIPQGYKACHTDYDCNEDRGEFCGFIKMDTPPVCRQ